MRPRIRTIKPELWCDERVCSLSRGARLTAIGLISAADDRGRLEFSIASIRGYVFPRDRDVSDRMVAEWVNEVVATGFALAYEAARPAVTDTLAGMADTPHPATPDTPPCHGRVTHPATPDTPPCHGRVTHPVMADTPHPAIADTLIARTDPPLGGGVTYPYLWLPRFWRHQLINRPKDSDFPAHPADPYAHVKPIEAAIARFRADGSRRDHGLISDPSVINHGGITPSRAGARSLLPIPVPQGEQEPSKKQARLTRARSRRVAQDQPPPSLPASLAVTVDPVLAALRAVQAERGGDMPTVRGVGLALGAFPDRDHLAVVRELEHWALAGAGQGKGIKDWVKLYRKFLEHSPAGSPIRAAGNGHHPAGGRRPNASELIRMLEQNEVNT
jgi:hypothetical protein